MAQRTVTPYVHWPPTEEGDGKTKERGETGPMIGEGKMSHAQSGILLAIETFWRWKY